MRNWGKFWLFEPYFSELPQARFHAGSVLSFLIKLFFSIVKKKNGKERNLGKFQRRGLQCNLEWLGDWKAGGNLGTEVAIPCEIQSRKKEEKEEMSTDSKWPQCIWEEKFCWVTEWKWCEKGWIVHGLACHTNKDWVLFWGQHEELKAFKQGHGRIGSVF